MAGSCHSLISFSSFQAHEDGGYIKLIVKEECKDGVPGPVQRVLKSFHTEVRKFFLFTFWTVCDGRKQGATSGIKGVGNI